MRGVFYVNNSIRNNHMVRYSDLTHIQLLHGESDKAASVNPVMRMYDRNFVAGQAAIDRFADRGIDMPREMFRIVGRPQVEGVEQARAPIGEIEQKTVLYAPTWHGLQKETDYSSLALGARIVEGLLEAGCTVIFRPHPYSYRSRHFAAMCEEIQGLLERDAERSGRAHVHGPRAEQQWSITDCFNAADAMVADVSSVVGDFLYSGKPMAMVSMHDDEKNFERHFPMARAAYCVDGRDPHVTSLPNVLRELLHVDSRARAREVLSRYYLGGFSSGSYADGFVRACLSELNRVLP
ncbi:CDP-glycerol glycerophosphotransferase family protein [Brachybacterium halotolerans subsp. kimchii]|uniref:CDP-glycerol glycerophosphotransferase family protein n=1 Tax=Brachybacterium halotolerans TaxID=2795215 RepID=UPI001E2A561F|nr:CDP-glycerol glycerophosphotransferase family protein [Brachybacterium halotolerans]UEJ84157.1 CDP-glycerol glycerophosphotransferase family protein [Brachybacterium halotolerans subsp. kimchii]